MNSVLPSCSGGTKRKAAVRGGGCLPFTLDGTTVIANKVVSKADLDADKLSFAPAANAHGDPYASFTFKVSDGTDIIGELSFLSRLHAQEASHRALARQGSESRDPIPWPEPGDSRPC